MAELTTIETNFSATNTENLRTPPYSLEAEQAVIGGLILDNSAWEGRCGKPPRSIIQRLQARGQLARIRRRL